jgi:hypothetical protein
VTSPIITVDPAYQFAVQALQCLTFINAQMPYPVQNLCFRVGSEVSHDLSQDRDLCCEGLGYVMLGDTYPSSSSFPEQDIVRQANTVCPPPAWAQQLKVGLIRCVPVVDGELGEFPTCDEWTLAFEKNVGDIITLRKMACCLRVWLNDQTGLLLGMSMVIERQTQSGPLGGCVERSMTLSLQQPNCDCG